jgi:hypothetical protein
MVTRALCKWGHHRWMMQSSSVNGWRDQPTYGKQWPETTGNVGIRAYCLRCGEKRSEGQRL